MEHKYRAWLNKEQEYKYLLGFVYGQNGNQIRIWFLENGKIVNFARRPGAFILEQYTGQIHEKREVYEGDSFQHPDGTKFFVKWDQGHCSFRANYYDDNLTSLLISQLDKDRGGAKYIGTIHDKE